jgi:hypothetical protein
MRLARLVPLVICLLGLGGLAPAAAPAKASAKKPCAARGSTTVARSVQARVYERGAEDFELIGCDLRNGRRTLLASWFNCGCSRADDIPPERWLAGRHVAVNQYSCSPVDPTEPCVGGLKVYNLRTGRVRYRADTGAFIGLAIKPNGSIGYVLGPQLYRIDSRGRVLLDEGAGIDAASLAVNRTRLYWLHDNVPRTASLR